MSELRPCPSCRKEISEYAVICPSCGWDKREEERIKEERYKAWSLEIQWKENKERRKLEAEEREKRETEEQELLKQKEEKAKRDKPKGCMEDVGCLVILILLFFLFGNLVFQGINPLVAVLIVVILAFGGALIVYKIFE